LREDVTGLIHSEIELAKTEVVEKVKMHARAAALVGIAIPFVFLALFAFLFAAIAALALTLPWWASGLIVGAAFLLVALLFAFMAMRSVRKAGMPTPDEAVAQAKATVEEIKEVRAV
jgi:uncharacterized membrane protein YqjE